MTQVRSPADLHLYGDGRVHSRTFFIRVDSYPTYLLLQEGDLQYTPTNMPMSYSLGSACLKTIGNVQLAYLDCLRLRSVAVKTC